MFAVADGQLLQGMKNRYLVDFSAYFIKMKIFEEVNDILHFLQSVTVSLGVTFWLVVWFFSTAFEYLKEIVILLTDLNFFHIMVGHLHDHP